MKNSKNSPIKNTELNMASGGLSKSKIIAGLQCPKRLWLQVHRPDLLHESAQTQQSYGVGNELGKLAQSLYPAGKLIEDIYNPTKAVDATNLLLGESPTFPIFEAAFKHDDVLIRADIIFNENAGLRLVEVKSATSVKDYHLKDCAIQSWVVENAGYQVTQVELAHVNSSFVYKGDNNYQGLIQYENITEQIKPLKQQVTDWVTYFKNILVSEMPTTKIGKQCHTPFDCPFNDYCNPNPAEYPITLLSYNQKFIQELNNEGITDVRDVPKEKLTTEKQHRIHQATTSGKAIIDKTLIQELVRLDYPRYYLDFETIGYVVPIWKGTSPYQPLPYQWSCHVETGDSVELEHFEYLDVSGNPPMRGFAESLIKDMGVFGPILVYSSYEHGVIKQLIKLYPDLTEPLSKIIDRLEDLLPLMQKHYYHRDMKGSWSIKAVLPTISTEPDYKQLDEIQNGMLAQSAYLEIIHSDTTLERREDLTRKMLEYCKLDTLAMVKLVQFFK